MDVKFLFMDEKYSDTNAPKRARVTSLTGVLVPANIHREFRDRFYGLVSKALGESDHGISKWPDGQLQAKDLLPGSTDGARYSFLEGVVKLVNEFDFRVIRIGFYTTRQAVDALGGELGIVSVCFTNFLWSLRNAFPETQLWPVMEIDRSPMQDQNFAGKMQNNDYMCSLPWANSETMWLKDSNFGEVLYMTKLSGYGCVVDCVGYLLHAKWLDSNGHDVTAFKKGLAEIASGIKTVDIDAVVPLNFL